MNAAQDDRRAENQALFREINERINRMRGRTGDSDASTEFLDFLCECSRQDCLEKLRMTIVEYEHVRREPTDFVVAPGHQVAEIERVLSEKDRFAVVRKEGRAAEIARSRDPSGRP